MVHVPYRGNALALSELLGGEVQVAFASMRSAIQYIRAGQLRPSVGHRDAFRPVAGHPDRG
jgi:tripartite-type tricarboxylate transporter receptor subunit TctC